MKPVFFANFIMHPNPFPSGSCSELFLWKIVKRSPEARKFSFQADKNGCRSFFRLFRKIFGAAVTGLNSICFPTERIPRSFKQTNFIGIRLLIAPGKLKSPEFAVFRFRDLILTMRSASLLILQ